MNRAILDIYSDSSVQNINKSTRKALQDRKLLGSDERLTDFGKRYAILRMPLAKQCSEISLEYKIVKLAYEGRPEAALLAHYKSLGYIGISSEGIGMLTILKALMLDKLVQYNVFSDRNDACTRYLEAQLTILSEKSEEIISSISSISKDRFISNFQEIISKPFITYEHPELTVEFAILMYDALKENTYISIARKIAEAPYTYRNGWPDLTLIKANEIFFVEVKTNDKLHESQLITIPVMSSIIPFVFCVCRVIK